MIEHFIVGGEETCLISDADISIKIIREFGSKKHEKKVYGCRTYCTMYQTRTAGGSNRPTAFIMKGKVIKTGYTYKMMKDNGA